MITNHGHQGGLECREPFAGHDDYILDTWVFDEERRWIAIGKAGAYRRVRDVVAIGRVCWPSILLPNGGGRVQIYSKLLDTAGKYS